ncbi:MULTISPECIES: energy-coupling factor transporter transmembrane protein EcfT [unclassified Streptococcus]|uniref:energy-coupling factor transporter transmembrane component T family protein n=1 Tax=unclassified Streptococcus TaxID=2608887 RepID=UPI001071B271|nr:MULTISPECIES: energy-coupling factor transporter transmembrane component T [unclassified Streptococcus]MBF0787878.1 energy-coupling factor transporter transmembrane protein EcfT [Streptococcus sp. 19428wC2_LYSM12]MCQ9211162.1 energy-coupling factor transporter transmembrane protein EcfT [Streptococcus sp. B01]MCQ9214437.1 energy-coupling factor transporter transmembrane protein EcfT [Streptococcus sp. O1]TFV05127.1 energy-coupling factor transporter transmembrane protein EcfT [Streptococcus 
MKGINIIGYRAGQGGIYDLSAVSKLIFFLLVSVAAMVTYDTRFIFGIAVLSLCLFKWSQIRLKDVSLVFIVTTIFALMNAVMVYLFAPEYGVELYGVKTVLWSGVGAYTLTSQELFYLLNLLLKYFCTIPLAVIFLMTTHPSQFASSLNQLGISYKVAYSVSLTMRYIPDIQEEFYTIRMSQEARGIELSPKGKLLERIKGNLALVIPLIFSSLSRIDIIATAMELRRFGKNKKRTWYTYQALRKNDYMVLVLAMSILFLTGVLFVINGGRFYNPWR